MSHETSTNRTQPPRDGDETAPAANATQADDTTTAQQLLTRAKQEAQQLKDEAAHRLSDAAGHLRALSQHAVEHQRDRALGEIDAVAEAIDAAASCLRDNDRQRLAEGVDALAGYLRQGRNYLRQHDPMTMLSDAAGAARRHPAAFLGGVFVAGLAAARFLQAHRSPADDGANGSPDSGQGQPKPETPQRDASSPRSERTKARQTARRRSPAQATARSGSRKT